MAFVPRAVPVLLVVIAAVLSPSLALYTVVDKHVLQLTSASFEKAVLDTAETVLVEFYAPWCGHCRTLAPEWSAAATKLHGFVKVAAVDCDAHPDLAKKYGVSGFPTIKVFKGVGKKERAKDVSSYQGERKAAAITSYGKNQMISYAARVKASGIDAYFTDEKALPHVMLFTDKTTTSPLFKALSAKFYGRAALGEVTKKELDKAGLASKYKIEGYPTLLAFPVGIVDVSDASRLDGDMTPSSIEEFIASYALPAEDAELTADGKKKANPQDRTIAQPKARELGIAEISSSKMFESECARRTDGLSCCLAFLPGGKASPLFKSVEAVADKYKFEKFAFTLVDSATEGGAGLAESLDFDKAAGGFGVMRGKKRRFAQIPSETALSEESLANFLDKVLGGDARYTPLPEHLPEWELDLSTGDEGEEYDYNDSFYESEGECEACNADNDYDYDDESYGAYDGEDEASCSANAEDDEGQCSRP